MIELFTLFLPGSLLSQMFPPQALTDAVILSEFIVNGAGI